ELFIKHKITFPVLMLRNSALWIDSTSKSKLDKYNISEQDIFLQEEEVIKKFIKSNAADAISLSSKKQQMQNIFDEIVLQAKAIDPTLEKAVLGEKQNVSNAIDKLEGKLLRAEKQRSETTIQHIRNGKNKLFPKEGLQERSDNFMQYYIKYGESFIDELVEQLHPFNYQFTILTDTGS
ncbi:MAG: bacillithiol biosynthesis BshC, partial [Fimbriimonadaceae bacterium]|nr:bacillithiol biosynthesis BshC [Chitinophagales bacterium]